MTTHAWTDSGKPIPYPSGQVSACVLCGEAGGATWDELVLCGRCEGEMVASLREPESRGDLAAELRCTCDYDTVTGKQLSEEIDCPTHGQSPTRACCDCGETFTPLTDHARRCRECAAVKYLG